MRSIRSGPAGYDALIEKVKINKRLHTDKAASFVPELDVTSSPLFVEDTTVPVIKPI